MRTTIDLPDEIMKKAKLKAVKEGITLKELFLNALKNELGNNTSSSGFCWKQLQGQGSTKDLSPEDSGFDDYNGPDRNVGMQVNDPSNE